SRAWAPGSGLSSDGSGSPSLGRGRGLGGGCSPASSFSPLPHREGGRGCPPRARARSVGKQQRREGPPPLVALLSGRASYTVSCTIGRHGQAGNSSTSRASTLIG